MNFINKKNMIGREDFLKNINFPYKLFIIKTNWYSILMLMKKKGVKSCNVTLIIKDDGMEQLQRLKLNLPVSLKHAVLSCWSGTYAKMMADKRILGNSNVATVVFFVLFLLHSNARWEVLESCGRRRRECGNVHAF